MNLLKSILSWLKGICDWIFLGGHTAPASTSPIRHVIVLMFENHSFDQRLGCFQSVFPNEVDGVDSEYPRSANRAYHVERGGTPSFAPVE